MRFPPDAASPGRVRRMVRESLHGPAFDDLRDTAVLLASELAENAVLHAGTEFEVAVASGPDDVTVSVSDRGAGPLEMHLAQPRQRYGRAATHGRGLAMVQRLASSWGTRHDPGGLHSIWFSLVRAPQAPAPEATPAPDLPDTDQVRSLAERARSLLHLPSTLADHLDAGEVIAELTRRLREVVGARSAIVEIDEGDGVRRTGDRPRRARRARRRWHRRRRSGCPPRRRCAGSCVSCTTASRAAGCPIPRTRVTCWSWSRTDSRWRWSRSGAATSTSAAAPG